MAKTKGASAMTTARHAPLELFFGIIAAFAFQPGPGSEYLARSQKVSGPRGPPAMLSSTSQCLFVKSSWGFGNGTTQLEGAGSLPRFNPTARMSHPAYHSGYDD